MMNEQIDAQNERKPSKSFDPIGSLMRHGVKIAVFGSILFILFSPVALLKKKQFYKAEGKLMIAPGVQTLISRTETNPITGSYSDYVRTQCERITAKEMLEATLAQFDPKLKETFAPVNQPVAVSARVLGRKLKAEADNGTFFVTISLEGEASEGLAEVINTLMTVYIDKEITKSEGQESRRIKYLQDEKTALEEQISNGNDQFKVISGEIGTVDFREAGNIYNKTIESLQQAHIDLYIQRINKENNLKAVIQEASAITALPVDADVEDFVLNSNVASQMDIQTYQQIQSMKESLEGLSENNPDRKTIEEQIISLSESLDYSKNMLKTRTHQVMLSKRDARFQEKIAIAESEFEAAKSAEEELKARLDAVIREKTIISDKILDGQQIEITLEKLQTLLTRIEERINEIRMEARAPGRISLETLAVPPRGPAGSNLKKLIAVCFILGFGSVAFVCVLFDLSDKRVRSRKDIFDALGAKVTWPVSDYLLTRTDQIPFSRSTREDSSNVVSKAIHSLAVRLDRERRENNAKLAVFTGVDARSGTSEILLNVAYAMTRLCKRVLVIDANLINPSFDRILLENSGAMGLVEHMREEVDFSETIICNPERQFDILPAGQLLLLSEINLIDRSKFPPMFDKLKESYDLILVDTPPILVSDFTEFLLLNADIVSLVVQGDRSRYDSLFMVGEILNRLQVAAIAVVLNWGAPRYRTRIQVEIDKLLDPIKKRITTSPLWSTRHEDSDPEPNPPENSVRVAPLAKHAKKALFRIKGRVGLLCGIIFLGGVGSLVFSRPQQLPVALPRNISNYEISVDKYEESVNDADMKTAETEPPVLFQTETVGGSSVSAPSPVEVPIELNNRLNTEQWILDQPSEGYTIQVMSLKSSEKLLETFNREPISGDNASFQKLYNGGVQHVIIHGVFSDAAQATQVVETLPAVYRAASPWIRRFGDIHKELRSVEE